MPGRRLEFLMRLCLGVASLAWSLGAACAQAPTADDDSATPAADDDSTTPSADDDSATPAGDDDSANGAPIELFGCAWNADDLDNLPLGTEVGRTVSYRFAAHRTGPVESVRVYLVFHGPGYFDGDGGHVLLQLQTDDGSAAHLPSGEVLTSALITDPMAVWNRLFTFEAPADVQQGRLYHLVFSNPAADPANNYVSVDGLYVERNLPDMQPAVSDEQLATLYKRSSTSAWEVVYCVTPIFSLAFSGGHHQGQCYIDYRDDFDFIHVTGTAAVRELFTVTERDRTVSSVRVRLWRSAGEGDLVVRLRRADGQLVEETTVASAAVGGTEAWVDVPFAQSHVLAAGQTYGLELHASAGATFTVVPLQDGTAYHLDCDNLFAHGHYQYYRDGDWGMTDKRTDFELQFYFPVSF